MSRRMRLLSGVSITPLLFSVKRPRPEPDGWFGAIDAGYHVIEPWTWGLDQ